MFLRWRGGGKDEHGVKATRGWVFITQLPAIPRSTLRVCASRPAEKLQEAAFSPHWPQTGPPSRGTVTQAGPLPWPAEGTCGCDSLQSTSGLEAPR